MSRPLPAHVLEALKQGSTNASLLTAARVNPRAAGSTEADGMNGLERDYAQDLVLWTLAGEVAAWRFKPFSLRLAPRTFIRPDFLVVLKNGLTEVVDTKGGHWEDDARKAIKLAAVLFPFWLFVGVQKRKGGGWLREEFPSS